MMNPFQENALEQFITLISIGFDWKVCKIKSLRNIEYYCLILSVSPTDLALTILTGILWDQLIIFIKQSFVAEWHHIVSNILLDTRQWFVNCSLPSHYLNQSSLIVIWAMSQYKDVILPV